MTSLLLALSAPPLACLAALAATAWAAGRTLRRWTLRTREGRGPSESSDRAAPSEPWGLDLALGLALLAQALWALAFLGLLGRGTVALLVLLLHGLALLPGGGWRDLARRAPSGSDGGEGWTRGWTGLAFVAFSVPVFVLALYPPTGFDETLYHLPFARAFAETGSLAILWDLRVPIFPQLAELLFAGAYLAVGEVGPHLVSLLAAFATAVLILAWGRQRFSAGAGWLGAAVFVGNPIVLHLATSGYIDALLMLFVTAGFVAVERGLADLEPGVEGTAIHPNGSHGPLGWFLLAGLLAGTAAGTKYLGLFFVAAMVVSVWLRAPDAGRWRAAFALAGAATVVLAPTYLRLWLLTGNPLFPFLPSVFGSTAWDPAPLIQGPEWAPNGGPAWFRWLRLPWSALFERPAVGWQPPFAPWLLLGLPLLARGLWRERRLRALCVLPLLWSVFFLGLPADIRYLMSVVPIVSLALGVAFAGAAQRFAPRLPSWSALILVLLLAAPGWLYVGYRLLRQGPLPLTPAERSAYLARKLPLFPAIEALNARLGDDYALFALNAENLRYFARGRMLGDWTNRFPYGKVLPLLGSPEALDRQLAEFGATHLLIPRDLVGPAPSSEGSAAWRRLFAPVYADGACTVYLRLRAGAGASSGSRSPRAIEKSLR